MAALRIPLACLVLLALSSGGLGADSEEDVKALETDLLTNMYTSKVNKARLPYWKSTLLNICSLINNRNSQAEDTSGETDEELLMRKQFPNSVDGFNLEAMLTIFQLQKICHSRGLQYWELLQQEFLDPGSTNHEQDDIIKRKTPYILKRQLHVSKSRRPYILKRSSFY
ncbi:neurotensin/neuromedin N isoform X2 [Ambystoma mexicanum]|uniref:neurotensin/neuromedin N isoform X2 n=1 Tax=Ambystoma mexicanum TaxID=8296 RepID=UPI0037E764F5